MITPEWVSDEIDKIRASAWDDEAAHSAEDELRRAVLEAISKGEAEDHKLCAYLALSTCDIEFARWCG